MEKGWDKKRQMGQSPAYGLFLEQGFEQPSMSQICPGAGSTKATRYGDCPPKEGRFSPGESYLARKLNDWQEPAGSPLSVLLAFGESR